MSETRPRRRPMRRISDLIPDAAGRSASRTSSAWRGRSRRSRRSSPSASRPRAGACRVLRIEASRSSSRPTRRSSPRSCGSRSGELLAAFAAAPGGGIGDRELRSAASPRSPAYNSRTCLPSRGDVTPIRPRMRPARRDQHRREARMAARLQMKLGVVAEQTARPTRRTRSWSSSRASARDGPLQGHLYLLVTSRDPRKRQEATRLAADTIRSEYYYDESAGIRVCIAEGDRDAANKRLVHQRRPARACKSPTGTGRSAIGVAVVRGNELYVATVGPAEAYLIRQARLSTLPDPHRERGLPRPSSSPTSGAARSRSATRSSWSRRTSSPGSGPTSSRTRWSRSIRSRRWSTSTTASWPPTAPGATATIAFEATEVAPTSRGRTLVPVRPAEPLAGAPDRSPIPLADNVTGGVAAVQPRRRRGADRGGRRLRSARRAAPGPAAPAQARVPPGDAASARSARRSAGRRSRSSPSSSSSAASACVCAFGGRVAGTAPSARSTPARPRSTRPRTNLAEVSGPGIDLVADDPGRLAAADRGVHGSSTTAEGERQLPGRSPRPRPGRRRGSTGCTAS